MASLLPASSLSSARLLARSDLAYLSRGLVDGMRADGRARLDYRYFSINTDVVDAANGSATVTLGGTRVIAAITLSLTTDADADAHSQSGGAGGGGGGMVEVSVECGTNIVTEYDATHYQSITAALSSALHSLLVDSLTLDARALTLDCGSGSQWHVRVSVLIVESAGNEIDAISWAIKAALMTTRIPKIDVIYSANTSSTDTAADSGGGGGDKQTKLVLVDDESLAIPFPYHSIPIAVTLSMIDSHMYLDCTSDEELLADNQAIVGVDSAGEIVSWQHRGSVGVTVAGIDARRSKAREIGKTIHQLIESKVRQT